MAYLPPHKRHPSTTASTSTPAPNPPPPSLSSSLRSLSLSSPRGRGRAAGGRHPRASTKIIHAAGCISRWSPLPPFSPGGDDEEHTLRLEPFPLLSSSPPPQDKAPPAPLRWRSPPSPRGSFPISLPPRRGPRWTARLRMSCGGSPVSLDTLRQAAEAGEDGSKSQLRKSFYTNVPSECLDDMERSMVKRMGLDFDSSKEHYHVKVFDKNQSDSTISCKCTVEEDGSLAIHKVELNQVRHLVEDISCLFEGLDLRLMLCKKRILKNLDYEVKNAVKSLVSAAIIDPNVKGGIRWPLGKESIGERFSIVGVWHTNYKAFRNETMRLKLRHADRFDHRSSTGEVSNEVTFKLTAISRKLEEEGDPLENSVKEMLESAVQMVWDNALNYQIVP
ncbi:unnamed protein product [Miscanthus lutarioriparius]|uniref:DUF7903 domain-containing protein n=1 Tax=Miscanthus lutarioriparius TaxID=422564 RepID=A0A811PWJ0_9POAL|nr:unnamed protein product [Miscanthus lutarioriparius]